MIVPGAIEAAKPKVVRDTFTRTSSGSLGIADSGQTWVATKGTWSANGSQATSADAGSTYPIASIKLKTNVSISADVSGGVGVAFWVSDANNWWAAYPYYSTSSGSSCSGPTVSCSDYNNTCAPGGCGTVSSSSGTSYSCSGASVSCSDSTNTCNPGGCGTISSSSSSSNSCTGTAVSCTDTTNNCNPGGGSLCSISSSSVQTYDCSGIACSCTDTTNTCTPSCYSSSSPCPISSTIISTSYSCGAGTYLGNGSSYAPSTTSCYRNSNDAYAGPATATNTYSRSSNSPYAYLQYTRSQPTYVSSTTYTRSQSTTVGTTVYTRSQATTVSATVYDAGIKIDKSVAGVVTNDSTNSLSTSSSANIASMQVITSGTSITAKGFSATNLNTQLGSTITSSPTTPTTGNSVGIVKAVTSTNQGSTVDNFVAS